jgi:PAS domain S-box-containing protein
VDEQGLIVWQNEAFARLSELPESENRGKAFGDLLGPEDGPAWGVALAACRSGTGGDGKLEASLQTGRGTRRLVALQLVDATGDPAVRGVVLYVSDPGHRGQQREDMHASKANTQVLLDTSPQAYFLLAPDYTIIKYNAVAMYYVKRVWNKHLTEGTSMLELSNPADEERFRINFNRALSGEQLRFDRPITYPDGLQLWFQVQYVPVYDESGKVEAVAFTAFDITERKHNEQALEKLSLVARKTDNIVIITDAAGIIEWVNEGFTRVTGYSLEEARGKKPGQLLQGTDSDPATIAYMRERIAWKQGFQVEIINYRKDQSPYWLYISVSPIHDEAGELTGFIAVQTDISARKGAEAERLKLIDELENTTARLKRILESITDAYYTLDGEWRLTEVNHAFEQMTGLHRQDILGKVLWDVFPGAKQLKFYPEFHRAATGKVSAYFEEYFTPLDAWFEMSVYPFADGLMVYSRPINARKQAEAEQNKLIGELSVKNRDLEQFAFITSHNLRAPVANLLGLIDLYNGANPHDPINAVVIEQVGQATGKLDEIIRDLNELLSVRKQLHQPLENVRFAEVFDSIRQSLHLQLQQAGALLETSFGVESVQAVRSYVQSILFNLLSNAVKYRSPDRTLRVRVQTRGEDEYVLLSVADNGMGIDLEKHGPKLFGLYRRFHTHVEGKGLGLHLIKTQIESLGGKVTVESSEGSGTTFNIYFKVTS